MGVVPIPTESTLEEKALQALHLAVDSFDTNLLAARQAISRLLEMGSSRVCQEAVDMARSSQRRPGYRYLLGALIESGHLLEAICDRTRSTIPEATELIRDLSRSEPLLDVKLLHSALERMVTAPQKRRPSTAPAESVESAGLLIRELLAVYDAAALGGRLMPLFIQLLRKQDPQIRSKVALLVGRGANQVAWAIADPDPRVRANAIESLWGAKTNSARTILWKAVRDAHQRVVGNALLGLLLIGEAGAEQEVRRLAGNECPKFRASMAWVMGQSNARGFLDLLEEMTRDPVENVRRSAARAMARLQSARSGELTGATEPGSTATEEPTPPTPAAPFPVSNKGQASSAQRRGSYVTIRGLALG